MASPSVRSGRSGNASTYTVIRFMIRGFCFSLTCFFLLAACQPAQHQGNQPIDRKALVIRHNVVNNSFDTLSSLTVGNGKFAMTVDATGLQSFQEVYRNGVSLGTFSDWGWHSFPDTSGFRYEEILQKVDFHGRKIPYDVQWKEPERKRKAADYFRQNPHRVNLGIIGMEIFNKEGSRIGLHDIREISQKLDLWEGTVYSSFRVDGENVRVITLCHQEYDLISVKISSPLLKQGRLRLKFSFPYPSGGHVDDGCDWKSPEKHRTQLFQIGNKARITRVLDSTHYFVYLRWNKAAETDLDGSHVVYLQPENGEEEFEFSCLFTPNMIKDEIPDFDESLSENKSAWENFWNSGGAVDFSGSTDPRASELERRIVLSQYLTKIQSSGPVASTGNRPDL